MFVAGYPRRLLPGLSLAALLLGCSVPEIDYYSPDGGGAVVDTGAPDHTTAWEESGAGVVPDAGGSDVGEGAADAAAADVTVETQSPDSPVGPIDGESDAADDPDTSDAATRDTGMTGSGTADSAVPDSETADSETPDSTTPDSATLDSAKPDVETFDAPDSADASSHDVFDAAEAQVEASAPDGSGEDADDGSPNTCPQKAPPGAATCCAHSPCAESQGNSCQCGKCDSMHCADWCCANSQGGMTCVASAADCH